MSSQFLPPLSGTPQVRSLGRTTGKNFEVELNSTSNEIWSARNLTYGGGRWVWLAERPVSGKSKYEQTLVTKVGQCPTAHIEKLWNTGQRLTQVVFGQDRWVVLANKSLPGRSKKKAPLQSLDTSSKFPSHLIKKAWNDKFKVLFMDYCDGMWLIITEDTGSTVKQSIVVKGQLPTDELRKIWRSGKKVSTLAYGHGKWVIIAEPSGTPGPVGQSFYASNTGFPIQKIKEFYAQKKRIHTIVYASKEDIWAFILEPRREGHPQQRVHYSPDFPEYKLRELGITPKSTR